MRRTPANLEDNRHNLARLDAVGFRVPARIHAMVERGPSEQGI
jgi:hypothetical protein